jgi:hypothetical protein
MNAVKSIFTLQSEKSAPVQPLMSHRDGLRTRYRNEDRYNIYSAENESSISGDSLNEKKVKRGKLCNCHGCNMCLTDVPRVSVR